jgi:hypothetical protein
VGRWVLGPEIDGEIAYNSFGHTGLASAAGATLPLTCRFQTLLTSMLEHEVADDLALRVVRPALGASRITRLHAPHLPERKYPRLPLQP